MSLNQKIEDAFQYRGNVTLTLTNGTSVEAFVYNREFDNPRLKHDNFIEVYLTDGRSQVFSISEIKDILFTGEDCAAGKSYADWIAKNQNKKAANS